MICAGPISWVIWRELYFFFAVDQGSHPFLSFADSEVALNSCAMGKTRWVFGL